MSSALSSPQRLLLTGCVALGRSPYLSEPQFSLLRNGKKTNLMAEHNKPIKSWSPQRRRLWSAVSGPFGWDEGPPAEKGRVAGTAGSGG